MVLMVMVVVVVVYRKWVMSFRWTVDCWRGR
jgi:hypothetical protein